MTPVVPCKRSALLLVILLLFFFFISITVVGARSMPKGGSSDVGHTPRPAVGTGKTQSDAYMANEEYLEGAADLVVMDYTPARKNPPIHN
uniref:Root meristem growth factor 9-like n=1 Tax=Nelumbo nucifera TaxID=4432 RepID=A0A822Z8T8_NELNU|nr:TPA_asm: hypothetical protein HUJ06_014434 [Nelumbo nucifera]